MKTTLWINVNAVRNGLARELDDKPFDDLSDDLHFDLEVDLSNADAQDIAAEAGYVDPDDASRDAAAAMEPNVGDLGDGLKALMAGDRSMARFLLDRAFDDWPAARRVVEDVIRGGRVDPDPRQLSLVA